MKKGNNKPHENTNNKKSTWRKHIEEGNFSQDEEINAIAERVVALKMTNKNKKCPAKEVEDLTNFNYKDLEAPNISDSENLSDNE